MSVVVIVKAKLNRPFDHWAECFDADNAKREEGGVHLLFRHPVIGEQAVVFCMRTKTPRMVHDMIYHPMVRPQIEESGFVVGTEIITVCDGEA